MKAEGGERDGEGREKDGEAGRWIIRAGRENKIEGVRWNRGRLEVPV